jgi:hypothetical protein
VELSAQAVDVWAYHHLARTLKFTKCEVLMVNTEGHDVSTLRSMMAHCSGKYDAWPHLIVFQTWGLIDESKGAAAEWQLIKDLKQEGYILLMYSNFNTYMMSLRAYELEARLQQWADCWVCSQCNRRGRFPYASLRGKEWCHRCRGPQTPHG